MSVQKDLFFFIGGKRRLESNEILRDFILFVRQFQFIVFILIAEHVDRNAKRNKSRGVQNDDNIVQSDAIGNKNRFGVLKFSALYFNVCYSSSCTTC